MRDVSVFARVVPGAEAAPGQRAQGQRRGRGHDRRRRERRAGAQGGRTSASPWAGAAPTSRARRRRWCCWTTTSPRIVRAVRLGRRIFDNLRKAMAYILAVHVPIAGLAVLPVLLGWPLLLLPVHVVFLELIIDPACSLVFEAEPEERT